MKQQIVSLTVRLDCEDLLTAQQVRQFNKSVHHDYGKTMVPDHKVIGSMHHIMLQVELERMPTFDFAKWRLNLEPNLQKAKNAAEIHQPIIGQVMISYGFSIV